MPFKSPEARREYHRKYQKRKERDEYRKEWYRKNADRIRANRRAARAGDELSLLSAFAQGELTSKSES